MRREFRAKWGEEASGPGDWATRMVQDEILLLMSEIRTRFRDDAAITLTVRDARHPDSSHDTIVSNDPTVSL